MNKWTDDSMQRAIVDFHDAIARDAGFAPAYAALAEAYIWRYSGLGILCERERAAGSMGRRQGPGAGSDPGRRPQGSRPDRDEPRLGSTRSGGGADPRPAARTSSAAAHLWNAWRLALLDRRHDQAIIELEEAERLDPLDLQVKTSRLHSLFPSRFRSRGRAVRKSAGIGAVLRLCALCAG